VYIVGHIEPYKLKAMEVVNKTHLLHRT